MKTNRFALSVILTFLGAASANAEVGFFPTGVIDMIPTFMTDDASKVVGLETLEHQISTTPRLAAQSSLVTAAEAVCPQSRVTARP